MILRSHDGTELSRPSEPQIAYAFDALKDPGDFLILADSNYGEVRAAGPYKGRFLLQCDLPCEGGRFLGERDNVAMAEAVAIFNDHLAGTNTWRATFRSVSSSTARRLTIVLIAFAIGIAIWWLLT